MKMKITTKTLLLVALFCLGKPVAVSARKNGSSSSSSSSSSDEMADLVREWSELALDMIAASFGFLSPPGVARALSMLTTAEWNAVVPFTKDALPVIVTRFPQEPDEDDLDITRYKGDQDDILEALSVAAFLTLAEIFDPTVNCAPGPGMARNMALPLLETRGIALLKQHATSDSLDALTNPAGIVNFFTNLGNSLDSSSGSSTRGGRSSTSNGDRVAAVSAKSTLALLMARRTDGMNARGDLSQDGLCYSDYTLYYSVNDAQPNIGITDCGAIRFLDKWQQLQVPNPNAPGAGVFRPWLAPYMERVIPFSDETLKLWSNLPGPPSEMDPAFRAQHRQVLDLYATLDDRGKVIAEFWADGPASTLPPGHWHEIAIYMTRERELDGHDTLRLLFLQAQAVMDAGIAAWTAKRFYDSARPISAIQCLFGGEMVMSWQGPYQGVGMIDAATWQPYQNVNFVTPPFAEYVSGHSTFSTASAEVMKRFFDSDEYGESVTIRAGESLFEPRILAGNPGHQAGVTDVPNTGPATVGFVPRADVTLTWDTFTDAAEEAGDSRLFGGIHIELGNQGGKDLGRLVGEEVWTKYESLLSGGSKSKKSRRRAS